MSQSKENCKKCEGCKQNLCVVNPDFRSTDLKGLAVMRKKLRCMMCYEEDCTVRNYRKYEICYPTGTLLFVTGTRTEKCIYYDE